MSVRDILLDENGDLKVENGDFVFGDAIKDNQRLLLLAEPGEVKHAPLIGVGLRSWQDDENPQQMVRAIRKEFIKDGMKRPKIEIRNNHLLIDAPYD